MTLVLQVEGVVGDSIEENAEEMLALANRLQIWVRCDFNGVRITVRPGGNVNQLVEKFHEEIAKPDGVLKMAIT